MRITGGRYAGITFSVPPGEIRPAMDRMRESLFGSLGDLTGAVVLDLFSGSGSMSLEAASRGAASVTAVERDRKKIPILKSNLSLVETPWTVIPWPAERFLLRGQGRFDIAFLDPPFRYPHKADLLRRLDKSGLLVPGSLVVLHCPREDRLEGLPEALPETGFARYGRSVVYRFTKKG
ncbi:MAG: 16S rRNA (guanine(966)-N(2))-methyltransferase RsmD [Spirochaetaceae bacterium]